MKKSMDRKEEIQKASEEFGAEEFRVTRDKFLAEHAIKFFKRGAQWADSHPRKGLVDIDKACEFLKDHLDGYDIPEDDIERSVETFKLAMEI